MTRPVDASVVVPTRDRPDELARCARALAAQRTTRAFETIVVDDGATLGRAGHGSWTGGALRVVRGAGTGPASARNTGIRLARGKYILFADDDTAPDRSWVETACTFLDRHPDHVGVSGVTLTPRFDFLYEHSLEVSQPSYWTCNIAYRREALVALGGFFDGFSAGAACEDLDLGYRASFLGPMGFSPDMRVTHLPRRISVRSEMARARVVARNELVLYTRHPERYPTPRGVPVNVLAVASIASHWWRLAHAEGPQLLRQPERLARFTAIALGQVIVASLVALRAGRVRRVPAVGPLAGGSSLESRP